MDSHNQLRIFCLCVAVGFVGGILYEIVAFLRLLLGCERGKNAFIGGVLDILFFLAFAILCIFTGFWLHFPAFRVYIGIGYALGGIIYLKILHKTLAIFKKVCYNMSTKMVEKVKKQEETLQKR